MAIRGAEIIALPNAADAREQGGLWEPLARARAVDNHVHLVSAVNFGRSLIVNPKGEILDRNLRYTEEPGDIVSAELDLETSVANWSGRSLLKRYLRLRRPETYSILTDHYWKYLEKSNDADRGKSRTEPVIRLPKNSEPERTEKSSGGPDAPREELP